MTEYYYSTNVRHGANIGHQINDLKLQTVCFLSAYLKHVLGQNGRCVRTYWVYLMCHCLKPVVAVLLTHKCYDVSGVFPIAGYIQVFFVYDAPYLYKYLDIRREFLYE